jgi:hypothetical protein
MQLAWMLLGVKAEVWGMRRGSVRGGVVFAASLLAGCFGTRDGAPSGPHDRDAAMSDGASAAGDAAARDAEVDAGHRGTRFDPSPRVCTDGDDGDPRAERVKATTVGLEEALTDRCDDAGNLIEHRCERLVSTDCAPCQGECPSCVEHTGRVLEVPFDCHGACIDGACLSWCPDPGNELGVRLELAANALHVENITKGRRYSCTPHPDGEALCFELDGYVGEQVYTTFMECFGDVPGILLLAWADTSFASMCFVDCVEITAP